jgi:putative peptidoglycan lipid II flippase
MRLAMFVAIPASVAFVALGEPIVIALFQRGAFDAVAARETARALAWQGGAIWTVSAVRQTVPVFYALGDTRTPVIVSVLDLAAFVACALALRGPMGQVGVSAAIAVSSTVQMALLVLALRRRIGTLRGGELAGSMARTGGASLVAALSGWGVARAIAPYASGKVTRMLPGGIGMAVFVVAFVLAAHLLGSEEQRLLLAGVKRRLGRRKR